MNPTFELTIQRCLEFDVFPVVVELTVAGQALPLRSEGRLTLSAVDLEELGTKTRAADYGAFLGGALFTGEVLRAFDRAVAQVGGRMNVLLSIEAPELRALHWEWLCIPIDGTFRPIAQDQRFPFCLFQPSQVDRRFPPFGRRDLRMLVVVASPSGLEKYNLEPFDEARALDTVVRALGDKVSYDVLADQEELPRRLGPPSLGQLCERLTAKRYTLLHIIAHGRFSREGETIVYLSNESGEVQAVPAKELLARLSQLATLPHFTFLAVCESAKPEAEAALGGLGQRLVRELGMPAVLAMTRKVSHFLAYELAKRLYPQLIEHGEVERALVEACAGLIGQADVSVPALYSRLGGRPLFSDDLAGRELTGTELLFGLDRMLELFADRAPVLLGPLLERVNKVRAALAQPPRVIQKLTPAGSAAADPRRGPAAASSAGAGGKFRSTARLVDVPQAGGKFHKTKTQAGPQVVEVAALSKEARQEHQRTLAELETLSLQVLDLSFAAVALDKKLPPYLAQCPFPGMRAFGPEEQRFFFGRDVLVDSLLRRLKEHPFLAVLGASGSGKSSVVRAGLLPRLLRDTPALQVITMIPGADPYTQLEAALERAGLREGRAAPPNTLLFVDQFEELFTLCPREKRKLFLQRLLKLLPAIPLVLTMRADFWGECAEHTELRRLMQEHQELVAPMSGHELRSAIEQQARAVGLRFEPSLCEKIVEHVQSEPGAMPLLQHALLKLWERRHGPWLSAVEYEALGGVQRAIAETADSIYNGLAEEDRGRMRTVFVRLTRVDDSGGAGEARRDTRQRVAKSDLIPAGADSLPYVSLIAHLADARLLVTNISPSTAQEEVEVVHEALIRHWPRLTQWLEEQRDSLALREALNKAARDWKKRQRSRQWLVHSGSRLRECDELVKRFPGLFNQVEQEYLTACRAQAQRSRVSWAGLLLAFLASGGALSAFAIATRREHLRGGTQLVAETQARQWAQGRHAGSLATLLALEPGTLLRSLDEGILAVAPFFKQRTTPPGAALGGLRDGLTAAAFVKPLIPAHAGAATCIALSADGATLASAGTDNQLRLFNAATGALLRSTSSGGATINALAFAPQGERLYAAASSGTVQIYDRGSGQLVQTLDGPGDALLALAVSPDGARLAAGSAAGAIRLFDLEVNKLKEQLAGGPQGVLALAFSADGQRLVSGDREGALRLWKLSGKRPRAQVVAAHRGAVNAVVIAPDSATIISGGEDHLVRRWSLSDGAPLGDSLQVGAAVSALSLSRGELLAVGDLDGLTTIWRLGVRAPLWMVRDEALGKVVAAVSGLTFAPEPARLAVAASDGLLRVWNLPGLSLTTSIKDHEAAVTALDFSPDRRHCLTAASDRSLRVYDLASGRVLYQVRELDAAVVAAAFAPPGEVTVLTRKGTVTRYQQESGDRIGQQSLALRRVTAAQLEPSGRRAIIAEGSSAQLWDLLRGQLEHNLAHPQPVLAVAMSSDGRRVATGAGDQRIRIFDADSGVLVRTLEAPGGALFAVRFSPDGRLLLSGGADQRVRIWDLASGKPTELPPNNSHTQVSLGFTASGERAMVASTHGMITLWDLKSLQPLMYLRTRHPLLRTAALSADGRYVLSGGTDGGTRLFLIDQAELWKHSCAILSASVRPEDDTRENWEQARIACATTAAP